MTAVEPTQAEATKPLTPEMVAEIRRLCDRYPDRRAVVLPALHVVHERWRMVPRSAVVEIAELLGLAPAEVQDTLSFYGFFKQDRPHGVVRAWVCRSISCALRGGDGLLERLCELAGTRPGEPARDGALTVEAAECLGACEHAPCVLANETLYRSVDPEEAVELFRKLRQQAALEERSEAASQEAPAGESHEE